MRELLYIPIIHTEVDMGSMSDSLRKEYLARYGKEKWRQHTKAVDSMWDGLCRKIFDLNLPYGKLRIYQDGLPVCGRELEIIREVAGKGSRNHKIVLELVQKGAKLEGTEDPDLLLQEYENVKNQYQAADTSKNSEASPRSGGSAGRGTLAKERRSDRKVAKMSEDLLMERDKFIARRIETTLAENELGILFMGLQHMVDKYLRNIKVSYLIHRLPFRASYD